MALTIPTPGIFWANSGVLPSQKPILPYETYVKWYEEVHIPDWMAAKPGAITAAWRYQSLDPDRTLPFLVTYKYPDFTDLNAPEFSRVSLSHPLLPEGKPVNQLAQFEVLSGSHLETWRAVTTGDERGPLLVTETIDPGTISTAQINTWYQETYINEIVKIEGWRRTSRFDGGSTRQPKWFALHEFEDGGFFGNNSTKISGLLGGSVGPKDGERLIKKADLALWKLVRVYGNSSDGWGNGEDEIIGM
ncbi:hypothetical protein QBC38DRAFT_503724 [Podospora fimiseda]|uniref:Uncharacterized protein n=1 Tax=Podospora fimiseda TaxID=252190 RepID=A0AAN6YTV5_9PEZI|nr:hypothetical protein QBC38DRAFT_503724 [Podospora fimiseda]